MVLKAWGCSSGSEQTVRFSVTLEASRFGLAYGPPVFDYGDRRGFGTLLRSGS